MTIKTFLRLIKREFKKFSSNTTIVLIFFGAPLLYGILFAATYMQAKGVDLPIMVVDLDRTPMSSKLIDMMEDNETVNVLSIEYEEINLHEQLLKNKYEAIVVIPARFEADIMQKRTPEIAIETNMANIVPANFSVKALQLVIGTFNAGIEMEALRKQGVPEHQASRAYDAVKTVYNRYYNPSANYMYFLWPGLVGAIIQQILLLALALTFAREFEERTYQNEFMRYVRSPFMAILIKSIPFWLMSFVVLAIFRLMYGYFQIPFNVDVPALAIVLTLFILSLTFMGILGSILFPRQIQATEMLMMVGMPSFVISGFTWPLNLMPAWVQLVSECIPLTQYLKAYRAISMMGGKIGDIQTEIFKLSIMTVVFFLACIAALWLRTRKLAKARIAVQ